MSGLMLRFGTVAVLRPDEAFVAEVVPCIVCFVAGLRLQFKMIWVDIMSNCAGFAAMYTLFLTPLLYVSVVFMYNS